MDKVTCSIGSARRPEPKSNLASNQMKSTGNGVPVINLWNAIDVDGDELRHLVDAAQTRN